MNYSGNHSALQENCRCKVTFEATDTLQRNFATTLASVGRAEPHGMQRVEHARYPRRQLSAHIPSITSPSRLSIGTRLDSTGTPKARKPKPSRKLQWRDLSALQKLQAGGEAAGRLGGVAFSLNLGIGREAALLNASDPMRLLSHYVSREFRKAFGRDLPYGFALEFARDEHGFDRLHAHGVIVPQGAPLDTIKQALARAGGRIEDRAWAARQIDLKPLYNASGWIEYLTKAKRLGKKAPEGRFTFMSRPLKQFAHQSYAQFGLSREISFKRKRKTRNRSVSGDLLSSKSATLNCFLSGLVPTNRIIILPVTSHMKGNTRMTQKVLVADDLLPEIFVADDRYNSAVEQITEALRLVDRLDLTALRKRIPDFLAAIDGLGMDRTRHDYSAMCAALTALEPVGHAEIEPDQVKLALGEAGNVWPEAIREDVEAERARWAAKEALEAARRITGPILAGVSAIAMRGGDAARGHVQAVRVAVDRQLGVAAAAAPNHLKQ